MKWLFVLLLALAIFGGAAWFGYNTFVKEEIEVKKEQRGEVTPPPAVDVSLPEFEAAVKLSVRMENSPKRVMRLSLSFKNIPLGNTSMKPGISLAK